MRCVVIGLNTALLSTAALAGTALAQRAAAELEMHAGPGSRFPLVTRVTSDDTMQVHGCVEGYKWCDVSLQSDRGWVPADQLEVPLDDRSVRVAEYGPRSQLPVVGFAFSAYWDTFYSEQPWYGDRQRWRNMWRDQPDYLRYGRAERGSTTGGVVKSGSLGSAQELEGNRNQRDNFGVRAEDEGRIAVRRSAETGVEPRSDSEADPGDGTLTGPDRTPGSVSANEPSSGGEIRGSVDSSSATMTPGNTGPATGPTISGPTPGNPAPSSTSSDGAGNASGSAGSSNGGTGSGGGGGSGS